MENINTLKITNRILRKYNIIANKRFGQNFLIDDEILEKIIDAADIQKEELVIEIGPGLGNLSEYILNKSDYTILVEIDKKMIEIIEDRFNDKKDKYTLLNEDVLKVDIDAVIAEIEKEKNVHFKNVKVIANLPYYITTPILFKLLQNSSRIKDIVVMVQKEVALRMVADKKTKDYGILTIMVEYLTNANIVTIVSNTSFIPAPNVESAVIKLEKNKKYEIDNENILFDLIHMAFAQRRKKMINSLVSNKFMNLSKEELEDIFLKCNLSLNSRAEELELCDYINIVEEINRSDFNEEK